LNAEVPVNPIVGKTFQRAEPMLNEVTQEETDKTIVSLKNWKAPGSDSIPSELIKYGGKQLHYAIFKISQKIWRDERVPSSRNEAIIIPLHKKGDKTICENYRGISLLNSAYKIFSKILLNRLEPYVEENLGEYQCGFRKGRSTIEQLSVIGQIIEKKYEYRQNIWQLFIYFKNAYDSVHRESLYNIRDEVGIIRKFLCLKCPTIVLHFFKI
jgi:sorting nexin-29